MIKKSSSKYQSPKPKLFDLIDDYNYKELSSYIQDNKNEIWNILIEDNKNCLHYTCEKGNEKMVIFIITQLKIRLGINSNFIKGDEISEKNINLFKYFINAQTIQEGYTPIHLAVLSFNNCFYVTPQQNINIIKFLLKNYSNYEINTKTNQNLLHLCAISNNINALVLFKEKYLLNINSKDNSLKTPLHYAAENNNYEILNILVNYDNVEINSKDKNGNTPIYYAIKNNNTRAVKKLIQYNANIFIKNKNKKSPIELGLHSVDKNINNIFVKKSFYDKLFFEQEIKKGETNIDKILIFFSIHIFTFLLNIFILMPWYTNILSNLSIIYITFTSIVFIFYFILFFSDPGYKDISDSKYSCLLDVLEDNKDVIKYCPKTFIKMEDNSRYCLICEKYIQGFNHHCYWVANCIGELNFNKFMIFLVLCIINIGYNLFLILLYFTSGIISIFFDLNKSYFFHYEKVLNNLDEEAYEISGEFNLIKGLRRIFALIGILICMSFLMKLIELFKFHYKGMKERKIYLNKKYKYI